MRIIRAKDYQELSSKAADFMAAQMILKPDSAIGLATGSTPEGLYQELVKKYQAGRLDFSGIRTTNLDEYKGLDAKHIKSYAYYMEKHLFSLVNVNRQQTFLPDGSETDEAAACRKYEEILRSLGGLDLQLLGLGDNGHIGFNEPGKSFSKGVHCVALSQKTIAANARFFENQEAVPKQSYTMGIKNIMDAKRILLVVSGKEKAGILKKVLTGPVTPEVPGSILQFHQEVTVAADEAALSMMDGIL